MQRLTRRKTAVFAAATIAWSSLAGLSALFGLDVALHKRYAKAAGLNIRGYRGPVAARKQVGQLRVVMLGGSTVFGYGVSSDEAVPASLERALNARRRAVGRGPVTVVNLGYNNEGAYSFPFTLRDYTALDYDVAILYQGYNDLGDVPNTSVYRHRSPVFRLTGYLPILPLAIKEKLMALRYGGNLEAAYKAQKTVFTARAANQTTAGSSEAAKAIARSLKRQLAQFTPPHGSPAHEPRPFEKGQGEGGEEVSIVPKGSFPRPRPSPDRSGVPGWAGRGAGFPTTRASEPMSAVGCDAPWASFCASIVAAVEYAVARDVWVIVVTPPYLSDSHVSQQQALRAMLKARYPDEPKLRHVDLGQGVIDLGDPALCFDGVHLTAQGNEQIAQRLVGPVTDVFDVLERRP